MRNEAIDYLKKETKNSPLPYDYCAGSNGRQCDNMIFSHTDRHLRQVRKVKGHPNIRNGKMAMVLNLTCINGH